MTDSAPAAPAFARRLLRRPAALICGGYLALVVGVAVVAPLALPKIKSQNAGDLAAANHAPSLHDLLGTDTLGRDVLDRLLVGTQVTMIGVGEALLFVLILGIPLGLAAGYLGGWVDTAVGWLGDLTFSVPAIVIIIMVLAVFPQNMLAAMASFGLLSAPGLMRVVRSATLAVCQAPYIEAARVSGLSRFYILTRHVLARISGTVIVQASFLAALALVFQTGLAFLNLLVPAPAPSWGGMVANGSSVILLNGWLIWPPGIAIALTIMALCLLGDTIRDTAAETWTVIPARSARRARSARPALLDGPARTRARRGRGPAGPPSAATGELLRVEGLSVSFPSGAGRTRVADDVSFDVAEGEIVGIVGESGSGKTVTTSAILGLLPGGGRVDAGSVVFSGRDLTGLAEDKLRRVRGKDIAVVSQEPMISLDPAFRVGWQIEEALRHHLGLSRREARAQAAELLASVHLPDPEAVARSYPHELSGGMAQRVAIARALAGRPRLLIADEPTTALDVTVQKEILDLLRELKATRGMAVLLVTHDWGVVAELCDRVIVMYAGQVVERAEITAMFGRPLHPYTEALLASNPHEATAADVLPTIPGSVSQPGSWPSGCRFHPRCSYATAACQAADIPLAVPAPDRQTRCVRHESMAAR